MLISCSKDTPYTINQKQVYNLVRDVKSLTYFPTHTKQLDALNACNTLPNDTAKNCDWLFDADLKVIAEQSAKVILRARYFNLNDVCTFASSNDYLECWKLWARTLKKMTSGYMLAYELGPWILSDDIDTFKGELPTYRTLNKERKKTVDSQGLQAIAKHEKKVADDLLALYLKAEARRATYRSYKAMIKLLDGLDPLTHAWSTGTDVVIPEKILANVENALADRVNQLKDSVECDAKCRLEARGQYEIAKTVWLHEAEAWLGDYNDKVEDRLNKIGAPSSDIDEPTQKVVDSLLTILTPSLLANRLFSVNTKSAICQPMSLNESQDPNIDFCTYTLNSPNTTIEEIIYVNDPTDINRYEVVGQHGPLEASVTFIKEKNHWQVSKLFDTRLMFEQPIGASGNQTAYKRWDLNATAYNVNARVTSISHKHDITDILNHVVLEDVDQWIIRVDSSAVQQAMQEYGLPPYLSVDQAKLLYKKGNFVIEGVLLFNKLVANSSMSYPFNLTLEQMHPETIQSLGNNAVISLVSDLANTAHTCVNDPERLCPEMFPHLEPLFKSNFNIYAADVRRLSPLQIRVSLAKKNSPLSKISIDVSFDKQGNWQIDSSEVVDSDLFISAGIADEDDPAIQSLKTIIKRVNESESTINDELSTVLKIIETNKVSNDLNYSKNLIHTYLSSPPSKRLKQPVMRLQFIDEAKQRIFNQVSNTLNNTLDKASWPMRAPVKTIPLYTLTPITYPEYTKFSQWVNKQGAEYKRIYNTSARLLNKNVLPSNNAWLTKIIKDETNEALKVAIPEFWKTPSAVTCLELGPDACPVPAAATNVVVQSVSHHFGVEKAYRNLEYEKVNESLCAAGGNTELKNFSQLMVCSGDFNIAPVMFTNIRSELLTSVNTAIKREIEEAWYQYVKKTKSQWAIMAKQDLTKVLPVDFKALLGAPIESIDADKLKQGILVGAIKRKIEQRYTVEIDAESSLKDVLSQITQGAIEKAALSHVNIPPIIKYVSDGALVDNQVIEKIESVESQWDGRSDLIDKIKNHQVLKRVDVLDAKVTIDKEINVSGVLAPSILKEKVKLELPAYGLDKHTISLLDNTTLQQSYETAKQASQAIEKALVQKEQVANTFITEQFGDVKKDFIQSCRGLFKNDLKDLCDRPNALWRVMTNKSISDWPLDLLVKWKHAQKDKLDSLVTATIIQKTEIATETLDGVQSKWCTNNTENIKPEVRAALQAACTDTTDYLNDNISHIVNQCNNNVLAKGRQSCLPELHDVAINAFTKKLFPKAKLAAASWQYILGYEVALTNQLATAKEVFLKRMAACVHLKDGLPTKVGIAHHGACPAGEFEVVSPTDFKRLQRKIKSTLKKKYNVLTNNLTVTNALCVNPTMEGLVLPSIKHGAVNCKAPSEVISDEHALKKVFNDYTNHQRGLLKAKIEAPLSKVCTQTPQLGVGWEQAIDRCFNLSELVDQQKIKQLESDVKQQLNAYLDQDAQALKNEMQSLLNAYGESIVVIDGKYCIKNGFFAIGGDDYICKSNLNDVINKVKQSLDAEVADKVIYHMKDKAKEVLLTEATDQLSVACDHFNSLMEKKVKLFGAEVNFDTDFNNACPPKLISVNGKITFPGDLNVKVKGRLYEDSGRLKFDWTSLSSDPGLETVISKVLEHQLTDVKVLKADVKEQGISAHIQYYPKVMPFPVDGIILIKKDGGTSIDIDFNAVDALLNVTIDEICGAFGDFFNDEPLELLADTHIQSLYTDHCKQKKLHALKFLVKAKFADPIGIVPFDIEVDIKSGIKITPPDFKTTFAGALTDVLSTEGLGIAPLYPWYTMNNGLTLHLRLFVPVPVVNLQATTDVNISAKDIKFAGPISVRWKNWLDTPSGVAFGDFGVSVKPKEKIISLTGAASIMPGEVTSKLFRVNGEAVFNIEEAVITMTGTSRLLTLIELSKTTTSIHFNERLFEHSVATGPLLAKVIALKGNLRIQEKAPNPFVSSQGTGKLFGAKIFNLDLVLDRDLKADVGADLEFLEQSIAFKLTSGKYFSKPTVSTGIEFLGQEVAVFAGLGYARAETKVFGEKLGVEAADLSQLDLDSLFRQIELKIGKVDINDTAHLSNSDADIEDWESDAKDGEIIDGPGIDDNLEAIPQPNEDDNWFTAYLLTKKRQEYKDCFSKAFGGLFCKTKYRTIWIEEFHPRFRSVAKINGMSWDDVEGKKMEIRGDGNPTYLQVRYNNQLDIYKNFLKSPRLIYRGGYPSGGIPNGNCTSKLFKGTLPKMQVVYHLPAKNGKKDLTLVISEGDNPIMKTLEMGKAIHKGICEKRETTNLLLALHKNSSVNNKDDLLTLYKLFMNKGDFASFELKAVGPVDSRLLQLQTAQDNVMFLSYNGDLPEKYAYIKLDRVDDYVKNHQRFLSNEKRLAIFKDQIKDLCEPGDMNGLENPCAMTVLLNNRKQLLLLERGNRTDNRIMQVFYENSGLGNGFVKAKWESNQRDDYLLDNKNRQHLNHFFSGLKAKQLERLFFKVRDDRETTWLAFYKNSNDLNAVRIATNRLPAQGQLIDSSSFYIQSKEVRCMKKMAEQSMNSMVPAAIKNVLKTDVLAEGFLAKQDKWFNLGWKANPLGLFSCDN